MLPQETSFETPLGRFRESRNLPSGVPNDRTHVSFASTVQGIWIPMQVTLLYLHNMGCFMVFCLVEKDKLSKAATLLLSFGLLSHHRSNVERKNLLPQEVLISCQSKSFVFGWASLSKAQEGTKVVSLGKNGGNMEVY